MKNEFQEHKAKDKIKWVLTGIAFLLVAVMLVGICLQLFGTGKQQPSNWFKKTECVHIDENTDGKCDKCGNDMTDDTDKGNVNVSIDENKSGIKLTKTMLSPDEFADYGVSPQAESAFTITATARDNANSSSELYQFFDWSMDWQTSNSAAITDFVTMTTTDSTATFSCKKAFSTKIIVKATSVLNKDVSATATLDYAKRISNITFQGVGNVTHAGYVVNVSTASTLLNLPNVDTYTASNSAWNTGKLIFCTDSPTWGTGSISNSINTSGVTVRVEVSSATQAKIKAVTGLQSITFSPATYSGSAVINGISPKTLFTDLAFSSFPSQVHNTLVGRFMTAFGECESQLNVTVTVPCTYGDTYTTTYVLGGNVQSVAIASASLSGSIVF